MPLWHCVTVTLFGWTPGYTSNVNVWLSVWLSGTRDDLDQVKYWWDDNIAEDVKSRQMLRVIAVLCRLWLLWLSVARGRGRRMFWGDDCLCIFLRLCICLHLIAVLSWSWGRGSVLGEWRDYCLCLCLCICPCIYLCICRYVCIVFVFVIVCWIVTECRKGKRRAGVVR